MMRLIDQPAGTGDLFENGQFRGSVHYSLNVYQQYDEGREEAVVGVQHIEGRITPGGTLDLRDLRRRGAEVLLKMSDGRALHFQLRDDEGNITLNGRLTSA
jgi:hypothetical protein